MEFSQLIEERRSIRHYDESKKVTKEQIEEMVQAAIQAPSWKNSQTARYYAVLSEDKLAELSEKGLPEFNAKNSAGASLIVTTFVANRAGFNRQVNRIMKQATAGDSMTVVCTMKIWF